MAARVHGAEPAQNGRHDVPLTEIHRKLTLMTRAVLLLPLDILCAKAPHARSHPNSLYRIRLDHSTRLAAVCRADS